MYAVDLLEAQHLEFERFFSQIERAADRDAKHRLVRGLADRLAANAPLDAMEEHLGIKRVLVDLFEASAVDETLDAKVRVLKEQIDHHLGGE